MMRRLNLFLGIPFGPRRFLILLCLLVVAACDRPQVLHKGQWIMGTVVEITWVGSPASNRVIKQAFDAIRAVDNAMNPDKPNSELFRINARAGRGPVTVSPNTCRVTHEGLRIGEETGGAFDITLGPLIRLWGWDTQHPRLPSGEAISVALKKTGLGGVTCDPDTHQVSLKRKGMAIDLGGIAKGFAVDQAAKVLKTGKIDNFIVNAGGDLYASGGPPGRPWRIGIQDPDDSGAIFAVVTLSGRAIATSGDYEHFFIRNHIRYHHILDPATGLPARGLRSVSVLAGTTMEADALATALFVMGRKKAARWLARHTGIQAVLMDDRHRIFASRSLKPQVRWKEKFKQLVTYF